MLSEKDFDSREELWMYWYLEELIDKRFIKKIDYHPKPFQLSEAVLHNWSKPVKNAYKVETFNLLRQCTYQADFKIVWNLRAFRKFFVILKNPEDLRKFPFIANTRKTDHENSFSVIDVKGTYSLHDRSQNFSMAQKWVFQKYGIYVQKIICVPDDKGKPRNALFPSTFTPLRFRLTDEGIKKRKINFQTRTLEGYINDHNLSHS